MKLLVTGGRTGYLGRHVVAAGISTAIGHEVVAVGSADADVRDRAAVDALLEGHRPDAVVHTAYVQSDRDVTATGAAHVAHAAAAHGARLVLVSSDVVFGGSGEPYDETAPTDPVSAYGEAQGRRRGGGARVRPRRRRGPDVPHPRRRPVAARAAGARRGRRRGRWAVRGRAPVPRARR